MKKSKKTTPRYIAYLSVSSFGEQHVLQISSLFSIRKRDAIQEFLSKFYPHLPDVQDYYRNRVVLFDTENKKVLHFLSTILNPEVADSIINSHKKEGINFTFETNLQFKKIIKQPI